MSTLRVLRVGWRAWIYRGAHRSQCSTGWIGSGDYLYQAPHQH